MSIADRELVKDLLAQAAKLPPEQRETFVRQAARSDGQLVDEVLDLLRASGEAAFMSEPTAADEDLTLEDTHQPAWASVRERPGAVIGRYKLLQQIGEGGFGVVFMAEQLEPVSRRVALKIIKAGMDTRQVIARFEAERQALALMSHPNIARVFDAGSTNSGRPFFVMELVRGEPITRYCDGQQLTLRQRLQLFRNVCSAVQHAHQKGLIHRDIKPSNVLVTVADEGPSPRVIDFGIAKATAGRLTDKTMFTEFQQLIGTPAYMSPEQADAASADIDTRSDIYSLGVLLYELLTGTTPFDNRKLLSAGLDGLVRTIREQEPPRPSVRLQTMSSAEARLPSLGPDATTPSSVVDIARLRGSQPLHLVRTLRGDLDWIVMKCLEKDRNRRYPTAIALSEDIARHLAHQPVAARPPSKAYSLRRFVRRNRAAVITAGLLSAALLVGAAGTTYGLVWAVNEARNARTAEAEQRRLALAEVHAREEADARRAGEEKQRKRAQAHNEFMMRALGSSSPAQGGKQDMRVADAMLQAVKRLESGQLEDDPETEAEILRTISVVLDQNGRPLDALRVGERALGILQTLHPGDHGSVADALHGVGMTLSDLGRMRDAAPRFQAALEMQKRLSPQGSAGYATALNSVAETLRFMGREAEALPHYVQALEMRQRLFAGDHRQIAQSLANLGGCLRGLGRPAEARAQQREALAMWQRLYPRGHPDVAHAMGDLALTLAATGNATEALEMQLAALEMRKRLYSGDHPDVAQNLTNLVYCMGTVGRTDEALSYAQDALTMFQRIYPGDHPSVGRAYGNLAACLGMLERFEESLVAVRAALEIQQRLFSGDHPDIAITLANVGSALGSLKRHSEALPYLESSLEMRNRLVCRDDPATAAGMGRLSECLRELGRPEEALPYDRESYDMLRRTSAPGSAPLLTGQIGLARTLTELRQFEPAESLLLDAIGRMESEASLSTGTRRRRESALAALVSLHDAWEAVEPGAGHGASSSFWQRELENWRVLEPANQP